MRFVVALLFSTIFLLATASAALDYADSKLPKLEAAQQSNIVIQINDSTLNVNNSDLLDGYHYNQLPYGNISGGGDDQQIAYFTGTSTKQIKGALGTYMTNNEFFVSDRRYVSSGQTGADILTSYYLSSGITNGVASILTLPGLVGARGTTLHIGNSTYPLGLNVSSNVSAQCYTYKDGTTQCTAAGASGAYNATYHSTSADVAANRSNWFSKYNSSYLTYTDTIGYSENSGYAGNADYCIYSEEAGYAPTNAGVALTTTSNNFAGNIKAPTYNISDIYLDTASTTALEIYNASGTKFINVDSTNKRVALGLGSGMSAPGSTFHLGYDANGDSFLIFERIGATRYAGFWWKTGGAEDWSMMTRGSGEGFGSDLTIRDSSGNVAVRFEKVTSKVTYRGKQVMSNASAWAGYAMCYTTGGELGHCISTIGASGTCTCASN